MWRTFRGVSLGVSDHSDFGNHGALVVEWARWARVMEGGILGRPMWLDRGSERAEIPGAREEVGAMVPV